MRKEKIDYLVSKVFKNQTDMAEKLGIASSRISDAVTGKTKYFSGRVLEKLIIEYNIDPNWLFSEEDGPIVYRNAEQVIEPKKYYEILEKLSVVQEELLEYKKTSPLKPSEE